jgi:chromosome segregation ATPase
MNNDLEGFGQWRRTVDTRLGTLETRVAEQASLRAQMDEDMSELRVEFRAQRTLLQALHDTQQEHSAQLTALQTGQQRIMAGVDTIREMLDRTLGSE